MSSRRTAGVSKENVTVGVLVVVVVYTESHCRANTIHAVMFERKNQSFKVVRVMLLVCVVLGRVADCLQVRKGKHYGAHLGLGVGSSKPSRRPYFEFFATECSFPQDEEPHEKCFGSKLHIFYHFKDEYTRHSRVTFKPKNFVGRRKGPRFFRPVISADHVTTEKYLTLTTYKDKRNGWDRLVTWFIRPIDEKWTRPTIKRVEAPDNASSWYGHSLSIFPGDPDIGGVLVGDRGRAFVQYYDNKLNKVPKSDILPPLPDSPQLPAEAFATCVTQPFGFSPLISQPGDGGKGNLFTIEKKSASEPGFYSVKEFLRGPWYDEKFGTRMVGRWRYVVCHRIPLSFSVCCIIIIIINMNYLHVGISS